MGHVHLRPAPPTLTSVTNVPPEMMILATRRDFRASIGHHHLVPAPTIDASAARVTATPEARTTTSLVSLSFMCPPSGMNNTDEATPTASEPPRMQDRRFPGVQ